MENGQTHSWDSRPSRFHFRKDVSRQVISGGEVEVHVIFWPMRVQLSRSFVACAPLSKVSWA